MCSCANNSLIVGFLIVSGRSSSERKAEKPSPACIRGHISGDLGNHRQHPSLAAKSSYRGWEKQDNTHINSVGGLEHDNVRQFSQK